MCVEELEDAERLDFGDAGAEKPDEFPSPHMESVCENPTAADFKQNKFGNFVPTIRSGDWSDIGSRQYMEDTHVCIADLAKNFGYPSVDNEAVMERINQQLGPKAKRFCLQRTLTGPW